MAVQGISINLTKEEIDTVNKLCAENDLSITAVLRQGLRWYQLINDRVKAGETFSFSGDKDRAAEFSGLIKQCDIIESPLLTRSADGYISLDLRLEDKNLPIRILLPENTNVPIELQILIDKQNVISEKLIYASDFKRKGT